jgi:tetratricopeptide (TPR) repeat protein
MIRVAVVLLLVIAGLTIVDRFLAQTEMAEVQREAREAFTTGSRLLQEGKAAQAVEFLRTAHVLARQNAGYELQLGNALLRMGKLDDAQSYIDETLDREPNDGHANLIAARLMTAKGMPADAKAYYHRAIYGHWVADNVAEKSSARMELIDALRREGNRAELLPELILLEQEPNPDPDFRKHLAQSFMTAGSPTRAAEVYRDLIARNPGDAAAYAGMGEAELQEGQYRQARFAFLKAYSMGRDPAVLPRLRLLNDLNALDPTPRRLTSAEKYRRSIRILSMIREDVRQHPSGEPAELLQQADEQLAQKEPAHAGNELAESVLALAEKLWDYRVKAARAGIPGSDEALRLIMERVRE